MTQFIWQRKENGLVYDDSPRPECLALIARTPKKVLDIGCNVGSVGRELKRRYEGVAVWGCEFNPEAAKVARTHYDHVIEEDVTQVDFAKAGLADKFDTVCLFDVLEHLYNPWELLVGLHDKISDDAQVLISLPNASNLLVLLDAMRGQWRYQNWGLLDFTHIRYFTDFDARKMFYQTGYRVEEMRPHLFGQDAMIYQQLKDQSFPTTMTIDKMTWQIDSHDELVRLCAIQNLYRITPHHGKLDEQEQYWASDDRPPTYAFGG